MSLYGPKFPARPRVDCSKDVRLTKQADRDEADVHKIIAKYEKTGMISALNKAEPFYGDVSGYSGLQDAFIKVQEATDLFMDMSAEIRERFDNDPIKMVEFLENPDNLEEAISLGMVVKRPEPIVAPPAPIETPK